MTIEYTVAKWNGESNEGLITITEKQYEIIHRCINRYIGKYCGPIMIDELKELDNLLKKFDEIKKGRVE